MLCFGTHVVCLGLSACESEIAATSCCCYKYRSVITGGKICSETISELGPKRRTAGYKLWL